jgi:hypothetical protein
VLFRSDTFSINPSVGFTDLKGKSINVYPNPASDILYVENLPENSLITIYSIDGIMSKKQLYKRSSNEIAIDDLPAGLYLLQIKTGKTEIQSKFIKR